MAASTASWTSILNGFSQPFASSGCSCASSVARIFLRVISSQLVVLSTPCTVEKITSLVTPSGSTAGLWLSSPGPLATLSGSTGLSLSSPGPSPSPSRRLFGRFACKLPDSCSGATRHVSDGLRAAHTPQRPAATGFSSVHVPQRQLSVIGASCLLSIIRPGFGGAAISAARRESPRRQRCDLMGFRHCGHSFFTCSAVRMQASQKLCPQSVSTGALNWSRQIGHASSLVVARLAAR
eukprot:4548325-Prymnesium_polylepis.3